MLSMLNDCEKSKEATTKFMNEGEDPLDEEDA